MTSWHYRHERHPPGFFDREVAFLISAAKLCASAVFRSVMSSVRPTMGSVYPEERTGRGSLPVLTLYSCRDVWGD
jgi:hypothetical protein